MQRDVDQAVAQANALAGTVGVLAAPVTWPVAANFYYVLFGLQVEAEAGDEDDEAQIAMQIQALHLTACSDMPTSLPEPWLPLCIFQEDEEESMPEVPVFIFCLAEYEQNP